jgi:hypothetical protein
MVDGATHRPALGGQRSAFLALASGPVGACGWGRTRIVLAVERGEQVLHATHIGGTQHEEIARIKGDARRQRAEHSARVLDDTRRVKEAAAQQDGGRLQLRAVDMAWHDHEMAASKPLILAADGGHIAPRELLQQQHG